MKFVYSASDCPARRDWEAACCLLANGLGGFLSLSGAFSVTRCDQGLLVAAASPSRRFGLVHRLSETLTWGSDRIFLSSQTFGDGRPPEEGWRYLQSFTWEGLPEWRYQAGAIQVTRQCAMEYGKNTAAVRYRVENAGSTPCTLQVTPWFQFVPKGAVLETPRRLTLEGDQVAWGDWAVHLQGSGTWTPGEPRWQRLFYGDDEKDGRPATGLGAACCQVSLEVLPGETKILDLTFSTEPGPKPGVLEAWAARQQALLAAAPFRTPEARELARSADSFLAYRQSTRGMTILAGYPYFGDWGRDTMIALPGCALATRRYEDAKSILRTFLAYEREGLVPNYFPEGAETPEYNSADAPLLLINGLWLYYEKTGDDSFVREAWPVVKRIVHAYQTGTRYAIAMEADGLIRAGAGLDQVTWMDVRVGDYLPTPRHGKPVEINAYWYNALRILAALAPVAGEPGVEYEALADRVRASFVREFWMEDRGYLKDVVSGGPGDTQLRCNQIWAVSMPFSMLAPEQERRVVDAVYRQLYTPFGLRTLSPEDPAFCPFYGGPQRVRDLAYHQGTVWPFPLGAWYLAYLKVQGGSPAAVRQVRTWLGGMGDRLREGCVGQLPEIYDGGAPGPSKGCFAQAWSVGELLRVYETLEALEEGSR